MTKIFVLILLCTPLIFSSNEIITGKVTGVISGDFIFFLKSDKNEVRIHLYGIECPGINQSYGLQSETFTSDLVFRKNVKIIVHGKDSVDGRLTGDVILTDSSSLGELLLNKGFAWWDKNLVPDDTFYRNLEYQARNNKVGLWKDSLPISPWKFRIIEDNFKLLSNGILSNDKRYSIFFKKHPIEFMQIENASSINNKIKSNNSHCSDCRYSNNDRFCQDSLCSVCGGSSEILYRRLATLELLEQQLDSNVNLYAKCLIDETYIDEKIDLSGYDVILGKKQLFDNTSNKKMLNTEPLAVNSDSIFNRFASGIQYYKFAIESDLKNQGTEYLDIAIRENNIQSVRNKLNKYKSIFNLFNKVYKIHSFRYNNTNTEYDRIRHRLNSAYIYLNQLSNDYRDYILAFNHDNDNFRQKYPEKITYRLKTGLSLYDLEKYKLLLDYFEKSYIDDLKKNEDNHLQLGLYCKLMGLGWHGLGDFKKAEKYYKLALMYISKLTDSCNIAAIKYDLGLLYYDNCEYILSNNSFNSSYLTFLDNFGSHHPIIASCQNNIGTILYITGEYNKAKEYYDLSLLNFYKFYNKDNTFVKTVLNNQKIVISKLSILK